MATLFSTLLGGMLTILTAIVVEYFRKAKLEINICNFNIRKYPVTYPAQKAKFLLLEVKNKNLPILFRWMSRNPALQCHGEINFYNIDGQKIFDKSMPIKWCDKRPATGLSINIDGEILSVIDHNQNYISENIYPGESIKMDVAAKFDSDELCYGWTWDNENNKGWRNKDYELLRKNYIVKVTLFTAGDKIVKCFRVLNESNFDDFRLDKTLKTDKIDIS